MSASWGVRELLAFVGKEPHAMTLSDVTAFRAALRERADQGEITRSRLDRGMASVLRFLSEHVTDLRDEGLVHMLTSTTPKLVRQARIVHDRREADIYHEVDAFAAIRAAQGYKRSSCEGVAVLLRTLMERGKTLRQIAPDDWQAFRRAIASDAKRRSHGDPLLTTARAYLLLKAEQGVIRPSQVPTYSRERADAPALPDGLATLPRLLDEAMEARGLSLHSERVYRRAVSHFLVWLAEQGISDLSRVTRDVMTAYRLELQSQVTSKGTPYATHTQLGILVGLRFFFAWLVRTGRLLTDPTLHLPSPRRPQKLPRPLKTNDVARLIRSFPKTPIGLRDRALVELLYGTGMRRAEVARLRLEDIDLGARLVLIREGKGRKDRLVPLGKKVRDILADYVERSRPRLLRGSDPNAFFVGLGGRALSVGQVTGRVHELGERVGLKMGPHTLRHSCATHLLKGHADIRHIQRLLGHRSLQTTERYTKVEVSDLRKVIERCHPRERERATG